MLDAKRYERIVVDRYRFRGVHGGDGWCALEILKGKDARVVVIATELADNPGMSITNAAEHLAYRVCVEFAIDPSQLFWVEHYGYAAPGGGTRRPRTYDLVTFEILPPGHDGIFTRPTWRPMRNEDWLAVGLTLREPSP
jgi:hypothetical protein